MNLSANTAYLRHLLGHEASKTSPKRLVLWLTVLVSVLLCTIALWFLLSNDTAVPRYITANAQAGDLTVIVTATGELKPLNQVEVGTEVSGTIDVVTVDYNDRVRQGQVLAKLDTEQLEARRRQTEAALALAKARVQEAKATVTETRNKLRRIQRLAEKALASKDDFDIAQATYLRAQAEFAIAKAQVEETQAQLDENLRVLEKAVIRAPIDGIVLKRQIEPGQTVAASLQTPVLFTLAENLAQMELYVAVDEADVGLVKEQQSAAFTVDAYPGRVFPAVITQVRYAPLTVDGVVTYEALLAVDNKDLSLRPGMTATADITVQHIEDALLVPNAALRFLPPAPEVAMERNGASLFSKLFPRRPLRRNAAVKAELDRSARSEQRVWTLKDGKLVDIPVIVGFSDGLMTEVKGGEIWPGMVLVVDVGSGVP